MGTEQFNQERLDALFDRWDDKVDLFFKNYEERCEIVYEVWKETVKPGCKGGFSAALRRMRLPASTAWDMVVRHQIKIGERKDPDIVDPRDEVEEPSNEDQDDTEPERKQKTQPKSKPKSAMPKIVLAVDDELAEAIAGIRSFHDYPDDVTTIRESLLCTWRQLAMPTIEDHVNEPVNDKKGEDEAA
jgi:hypothetical protein